MEQFGKLKSEGVAMNNFLSIVLFTSLTLANTSYIVFGSDLDDNSDIKSFGYNHKVVKLNKFDLAIGGDYSVNLSGDSYFNSYDNLDLASIYLLLRKSTHKVPSNLSCIYRTLIAGLWRTWIVFNINIMSSCVKCHKSNF